MNLTSSVVNPSPRGALVAAAVLVAAVAAGCGPKSGPTPQAASGRAGRIGRVVVTVADAIDADRRERFLKVGGVDNLTAALTAELSRAGRLDLGSATVMEVTVTTYRMRSGAAVAFFGVMAGGDSMDVDVTITDGSGVVRRFNTGAGGVAGGFSQESRFERVAKAVAERVVEQL